MLRYTQVLERAGDALRVRYNLGQRGGGRSGWGDRGDAGGGSFNWQLQIPAAAEFGTPYSPTHQLTTRRESGRLEISLDSDASGEVEVSPRPLRHNLVGTSIVTYAPGGEDGYYMLLLAPPPAGSTDALPRDVSLVVDVSGSMSGEKMDQARAALDQALGTLGPRDRFRVVGFGGCKIYGRLAQFLRVLAEQPPRDDQHLDLLRALEDVEDLRVARPLLEQLALAVAERAAQLHAAQRDVVAHARPALALAIEASMEFGCLLSAIQAARRVSRYAASSSASICEQLGLDRALGEQRGRRSRRARPPSRAARA